MPIAAAPPSSPLWTWLPRDRAVTAEQQARTWLAHTLQVAGTDIRFARDARGRPHLQPPLDGHDCNWSHSGDGLLVAVGAGMRVGADLEWRRPRPRALEIAARFFHPDEVEWLTGVESARRDDAFLRLWCAKEAVLKAHGHGVSFGLERLRFGLDEYPLRLLECDPALGAPGDWHLRELAPADGYLGALAWRAAVAGPYGALGTPA